MKQLLSIILILFFVAGAQSQSIDHVKSTRISDNFDALSIQAYSANGQEKVVEFVEYLNMLSNLNGQEGLKKELYQSIELLFKSGAASIQSMGSGAMQNDIQDWLHEFEDLNIKSIDLKLEDAQLGESHWTYIYTISFDKGNRKFSKKMMVELSMKKVVKSFGDHQKMVWQQHIQSISFKDK